MSKAPRPGLALPEGDTWVALSEEDLAVDVVSSWVGREDCGAVVLFCGNARNHSGDRSDVTELAFEAYTGPALSRMELIVSEARERWPEIVRLALLHRTGVVTIGKPAVVVATSSPHRDAAYMANRFCIDTLKLTVPIWKSESWQGGERWALDPQHLVDIERLVDPGQAV